MKQQIALMLTLQDEMNTKVNSDWREQGFEWYRAIWVECAEMLDHYGWKWWKAQAPDMPQVELELIDIWHFGLSDLLQSNSSQDDVIGLLSPALDSVAKEAGADEVRESIESFAAATLQSKHFDVKGFVRMMSSVNLSFDELFSRYVAKNVLNIFRQDHGYKDGTYVKTWQGREDNEHLMDILEQVDGTNLSRDGLYDQLKARYVELSGA